MTVVLFRVDERLIHGQVVIGWGHELRPDRYAVVDDGLSESEWEQELYRLGAGDAEVVFSNAEQALRDLPSYQDDQSRTIVLTRDVATMRKLVEGGGLAGRTVNVGGIHPGPGRSEVVSYVHLAPPEVEEIRRMLDAGARVQARDLPDAARIDLAAELSLR